MVVKPDWNIFKENFSENPTKNFEWMCYQLFCRQFHRDTGIFRYYNQPSLEAEPIKEGDDVIGFQAKFYKVSLNERDDEIKKTISDAKKRYNSITIIYFYIPVQ